MNVSPKIRISCATLNRIVQDGSLLVAINRNRFKQGIREYSPIGGATELLRGMLTNSIKVEFEKCDLRLSIQESDLARFDHWFQSKQDREIDPFRELREELVDEIELLSDLEREDVKLTYIKLSTDKMKSKRAEAKGMLTKHYFEVFEVIFSKPRIKEIEGNLGNAARNPDSRARFVTPQEIRDGRTSNGILIAENCLHLLTESQ